VQGIYVIVHSIFALIIHTDLNAGLKVITQLSIVAVDVELVIVVVAVKSWKYLFH